jgi:hypothetical protein
MEVSGQINAPAALPSRKDPWYQLDRELSGLHGRSGCGGEEKNSQPLSEIEPPIIRPVAQRYMTDTEQFICDLLVTHLTLNSSSSSFSFSL